MSGEPTEAVPCDCGSIDCGGEKCKKQPPTAVYAALFPLLQMAARRCGYALALHGSLRRDMDLVAVPWTEEATDGETLTEALRAAVGGKIYGGMFDGKTGKTELNPVKRPHGRRGWVIHLGGGPYLDVSVLPRVVDVNLGR